MSWMKVHFYFMIDHRKGFQIPAFCKLVSAFCVHIVHQYITLSIIKFENTGPFNGIFCLLNKVTVDSLVNKDGSGFNPFKQPHYMLLNLAIGGTNGGNPEKTKFPRKFEVDYVRVYQLK